MTAFSSTIRNTVLVFGPEPTEKWAVTGTSGTTPLIWGTDKWAYGTVGLPMDFTKVVLNSLIATGLVNVYNAYTVTISGNTFTVSNAVGKNTVKGIVDNTFTVSNAITGKSVRKFYDNATVITTTISRGMFISVYGSIVATNTVSPNVNYNKSIPNSFILTGIGYTNREYNRSFLNDIVFSSDIFASQKYLRNIKNTLLVFGISPTEKWDDGSTGGTVPMVWGVDNWAYGTVDVSKNFTKGIFDDSIITGMVGKVVSKGIVDNTFTISNGITGKDIGKGVFNSQEVTNTIGKDMMHFYDNSTVMTTAVGKDVSKGIFESFPITNIISTGWDYVRIFSGIDNLNLNTTEYVYAMRDNYYITNGGISNVVSWPRATIYTSTTRGPLTWSNSTTTTTTWV